MKRISGLLLAWYAQYGRTHLPWRETREPYRILVSEFMLQQTQVERVLPKYNAFVEAFPDIRALAAAGTDEVIRLWQGLGYNSRAVRLQRLAREVVERYGGELPRDPGALRDLPGIGPYTVAAVTAFAFNEHAAAMDTNIRRVVHRALFGIEFPPKASAAHVDAAALDLVPPGRAHDWNSAMMDLGSQICTARAPKCPICPLANDCAAAPVDALQLEDLRRANARKASPQEQIPFERTTRFARGRIVDVLRALPSGGKISLLDLHAQLHPVLGREHDEFGAIVRALERDGIVETESGQVGLAR